VALGGNVAGAMIKSLYERWMPAARIITVVSATNYVHNAAALPSRPVAYDLCGRRVGL